LLKALPPLGVIPRLKGVNFKITDLRLVRLRLVKELGSYIDFTCVRAATGWEAAPSARCIPIKV
jgi:hypothetical protein